MTTYSLFAVRSEGGAGPIPFGVYSTLDMAAAEVYAADDRWSVAELSDSEDFPTHVGGMPVWPESHDAIAVPSDDPDSVWVLWDEWNQLPRADVGDLPAC